MDEETLTIKIPNDTEKYPHLIYIVVSLTIFSCIGFSQYHDLFFSLILFMILLSVGSVILFVEYKIVPWDRPNIYKITGDELWYSTYYKEGNPFIKHKFSSIKKVVVKNHRIKWIELWFRDNEEQPLDIISAPFFEKCNDDWQRLFEEIRKRLPPDAEVIVK